MYNIQLKLRSLIVPITINKQSFKIFVFQILLPHINIYNPINDPIA